jgi:hypothetical protein
MTTTIATYAEDVTLIEGKTVSGRYAVRATNSGWIWERNAARTRLTNQLPTGVKFPSTTTRACVLDGFAITTASAASPTPTRLAGITIEGSGLVRDFSVAPGVGAPAEAVGVSVTTVDVAAPAFPRLEGNSTTDRSQVIAGSSTSPVSGAFSAGVLVTNARVDSQFVDISAGSSSGIAYGVRVTGGGASTIRSGTINGASAPQCYGLLFQGAIGASLVDSVTATGCPITVSGPSVSRLGTGIAFEGCGGAFATVQNSLLAGGVVSGAGSRAVGALALNGCPITFQTNPSITGVSQTGIAEFAAGLQCSYRTLTSSAGADSRCNVLDNTTISSGDGTGTTAVGAWCEGSCAASTVTCSGSCANIGRNTSIVAKSGTTLTHLLITDSGPEVFRNQLSLGRGGPSFCTNSTNVVGLGLTGASGLYTSNFISAAACPQSNIGVLHTVTARSGGTPSPTLHSNTIVASPASSSLPNVSIGVLIRASPGGAGLTQGGAWRSNIVQAGPVAGSGTAYAFREESPFADPLELTNNLLYVVGRTVVYLDENVTPKSTALEVNSIPGLTTSANLVGDPLFTPAGFFILTGSPAKQSGPLSGPNNQDYQGEARPQPAATAWDIGADEIP